MVRCIEKFDILPVVMNVGLGHDYSVTEYYKMVAKVVGYKGEFIYDTSKPSGVKRRLVDISLMKKWGGQAQASTDLETGISKTYQYYLKYK